MKTKIMNFLKGSGAKIFACGFAAGAVAALAIPQVTDLAAKGRDALTKAVGG